MGKFIDFKIIVSVLLALVVYDLVVKGLVMRKDTYEYDEFEGGQNLLKVA